MSGGLVGYEPQNGWKRWEDRIFLITPSWFRERHDVTQAHHESFQEAQAGPAREDRSSEIQGVVSLTLHPQRGNVTEIAIVL